MDSEREMDERYKRDIAYFLAHYDELLKQYPEQSIAILDQQVIASDPDPWRLLDALIERGLPVERILFEHLAPMNLIV
jgi:hypothetical protein